MKKEVQPVVAIIGRPNVGKSTFFNRLCGKRKAIESALEKTTVDRIYGGVNWCGKKFSLIDTAGIYENDKNDQLQKNISDNINLAIEQSDLIIFLVDVMVAHSYDREIAKLLRKSNKKILLVANKSDNQTREIVSRELLSLGLGEPIFISAISGRGVGDLLEKISQELPKSKNVRKLQENIISISLIGRPNVGKSTILNSLLGEDRAIVSSIPGTTRDINDALISFRGTKYRVVDTAGIRRRGKIDSEIEKFSIIRSVNAIKESDVSIIIIDADEGITNQDAHIAGTAKDMGKSIIIAINKFDIWDQLAEEKKKEKMAIMIEELRRNLAFLPYVPIVFVSGLEKTNIKKLLSEAKDLFSERNRIIDAEEVEKIGLEAKSNNQQFPNFYSFYQERSNPPVFKLEVRDKKRVHFSHLRYLENFIRNYYPFRGTPIFIDLLEKSKKTKN
ncbi:MAG: ribosome biogenesis GTPase Der [Patescibacteria group bacterium]|jgi:GTP-binding protein|nr:ribosome biogenesis GTPase Der [Patescibacteria group bacterium]